MTVAEVDAAVERIREMAGDDEAAHSAEDELRDKVLEAIAAGARTPAKLAAAALLTNKIEFARWCA